MDRKLTKSINVGGIPVGGNAPITVQSMTNTKAVDIKKTCEQIAKLTDAGCDIVRLAVPDNESAVALAEIVKFSKIPVVADIHFDYRLALEAVKSGVSKIRINPGNIGGEDKVRAVVDACREREIPIRIGVNSGSLPKDILVEFGKPTPEAMIKSAERHVKILENMDFANICLSLKASNVPLTIATYRLASQKFAYPLHLGVTEAGTKFSGTIQSAVGIGTLLSEGIGDTIRVSLTADPVEEIHAGIAILKASGVRRGGVKIVSCPTCGRCEIDLIKIAEEVERRVSSMKLDINVAVMGCIVNGPGEAKEADYGIAGGKNCGLLFKKGEIVAKIEGDKLADALVELIESENMEKE